MAAEIQLIHMDVTKRTTTCCGLDVVRQKNHWSPVKHSSEKPWMESQEQTETLQHDFSHKTCTGRLQFVRVMLEHNYGLMAAQC